MPSIDQALLHSVRQSSRKALEDIGANTQKTGKEKVRESTMKTTEKGVARRGRQLAQFVAEEGKGNGVSKSA
ncbi:MAG: hypothetical protein HZA03_11495 [Nitrospinae bacterium]|nr:hypothetical protein [Nitrospinota bacterium]